MTGCYARARREAMDSATADAFEKLSREVREGLQDVRTELRAEIQDVKRHSDVIAESLRGEIRLVAEGVAGLDEKFTREFRNVREEVREQIGEVKTLLRLSYADLDRRIRPS